MTAFGGSAVNSSLTEAEVEHIELANLNSFQVKFFRGDLNKVSPNKEPIARTKFERDVAVSKTAVCARLMAHGFENEIVEKITTEQERYDKLVYRYGNRGVRPGKIDTGMKYTPDNGSPYTVVSSKFAKALANGNSNVLRITKKYFYIKLDDQGKAKLGSELKKFRTDIEAVAEKDGTTLPEDINWVAMLVENKKLSPGDFIENYGGTVVICFDYTHKHNRPVDWKGNELKPVEFDEWSTDLKNKLFSTPAILHGWNNDNGVATANFNSYNFTLGPNDTAMNEIVTDNGKLRVQKVIRQPGE